MTRLYFSFETLDSTNAAYGNFDVTLPGSGSVPVTDYIVNIDVGGVVTQIKGPDQGGPLGQTATITNNSGIYEFRVENSLYTAETTFNFEVDGDGTPTFVYGAGSNPFARASNTNFEGSDPADPQNAMSTNPLPVPCFTRDTLISTPAGSTPVQDLRIGDLILNHQGQALPVKWIGTQRFHPAFIPDELPVCISAGALGGGLPLRDLFVSPRHAMYLPDGVLVDAKALTNGTTINQVQTWKGSVDYFHIETEHHEIILAEGAPAETFMDHAARTCFNNYAEYEELYPNAHEMIELDIPRISHKRQLPNAIKNRLEVVATSLLGNQAALNAA